MPAPPRPRTPQLRASSRMAAPRAQLRITAPSCPPAPCEVCVSPSSPHLGSQPGPGPTGWCVSMAERPLWPAPPRPCDPLKSHTGVSGATLLEPPVPLTSSPQDTVKGLPASLPPPAPRPEDRQVSRDPGGPQWCPRGPAPCWRRGGQWGPVETTRMHGSCWRLGLWLGPAPVTLRGCGWQGAAVGAPGWRKVHSAPTVGQGHPRSGQLWLL